VVDADERWWRRRSKVVVRSTESLRCFELSREPTQACKSTIFQQYFLHLKDDAIIDTATTGDAAEWWVLENSSRYRNKHSRGGCSAEHVCRECHSHWVIECDTGIV
jgi:hypothetical protein